SRRAHAGAAAAGRAARGGRGGARRRLDARRRGRRGGRSVSGRGRRAGPGRGRPGERPEDRHVAAARHRGRPGRPHRRRVDRRVAQAHMSEAEAPINQSVERAVRLLGFFSAEEPELTPPQLTERLGTARATTHRYAMALRRVGLLRYDAAGGIYSLGPRIVELAATALSGLRIIRIAGPHMERLAADLNETVVLSIWDGESPIVVRVADNTDRLVHIVVRTGSRL